MRAVRLSAVNRLEIAEVPAPVPAGGEVVVTLRAAALNHRDVWIKAGQYAGLKWPCIPGSDGAGVVTSGGAGWLGRTIRLITRDRQGRRVNAPQSVKLWGGLIAEDSVGKFSVPVRVL